MAAREQWQGRSDRLARTEIAARTRAPGQSRRAGRPLARDLVRYGSAPCVVELSLSDIHFICVRSYFQPGALLSASLVVLTTAYHLSFFFLKWTPLNGMA